MSKVRYIVTQREVWLRNTEVVADSSEGAITAVEAGEGEELSLGFSHALGRENTTTKIAKGPSEVLFIARRKVNDTSPYTAYFGLDDTQLLIDCTESSTDVAQVAAEIESILGTLEDKYTVTINKLHVEVRWQT